MFKSERAQRAPQPYLGILEIVLKQPVDYVNHDYKEGDLEQKSSKGQEKDSDQDRQDQGCDVTFFRPNSSGTTWNLTRHR